MFNGELVEILLKGAEEEGASLTRDQIILAFAAGSHQHGARIEGKSDLDVAGVYIGNPEQELGIGNEDPRNAGHITTSTAGDKKKNTSKDKDLKVYTLRRWAGLALKGNPNVLSYLFVPDGITDWSLVKDHSESVWADDKGFSSCLSGNVWRSHILRNKSLFLSSGHATAFLGFGDAQYKRMVGEKGSGKHGHRDEVIAEFGYCPKAAMHMIRGMYEALELLQTGYMPFPRPEVADLLDIRNGKWSQTRIENTFKDLYLAVQEAEKTSPLPPVCDRKAVTTVVVDAMLAHWEGKGFFWL